MYLSYSGYKTYTSCPLSYWHKYVAKTVPPEPDNRVGALYGSVVGTLFELFYNERIWAKSGSEAILLGKVDGVFADVMKREQAKGGTYNWKAPKLKYRSVEAVAQDVRDTVPRGLAIIRQHRLIGREAAAEVKLDAKIGDHLLAGRADFVIRRVKPQEDLVIMDGKGSAWRETYVDAKQLLWYAMLYQKHHKMPPDQVGFVFWRCEPDAAVDWVPFTAEDLEELRASVLSAITDIQDGESKAGSIPDVREVFPSRPANQCKLCTFLGVCTDGQNIASDRLQVPSVDGVGVEDIGLS